MHLTPIALVLIVLACPRRKVLQTNLTTQLKSKDYTLPYLQESRGIVTTAGGSHLLAAVVSIRILHRTGSELPVEGFLAS
jgi:alpha 1,2-mannosyltransferase